FQNGAVQKPTRIQVFDNFTIELFRAGKLLSNYFQMGTWNHDDSGDLLSQELEKNLRICIDAKAKKLSYLRSRDWESCWLAPVDLISYGCWNARDRVNLPPHTWDKIMLINPLDPTRSFELV